MQKLKAFLFPFLTVVIGIGLSASFIFAYATVVTEEFNNLSITGTTTIGTVVSGSWKGTSIDMAHGGLGSNSTSSAQTALGMAMVAKTGSYNDLSNQPTIPATQVQADWTQANTTSAAFLKNKPTLYYGATQMPNFIEAIVSTTITSTIAIFPAVNASGIPLFTMIFPESAVVGFVNSGATFANSSSTLSIDHKTITVTINRQGFSSSNVLLNLLGNLTSVLNGVSYTAAPTGTVIYLDIKGI